MRRSPAMPHQRRRLSLGDRVENSKLHVAFPEKSQLWGVCLTLFICIVAAYVAAFYVNDAIMRRRVEGWRDYPSAPVQESVPGSQFAKLQDTPISNLDDREFLVYVAIFVAVTLVQAGLGLELLIWISFLENGWSKEFEKLWKLAQFAFPLFVLAAVGMAMNRDYFAMIFIVLGLWKFGLPETHMYLYSALYNGQHTHKVGRVADFLNGAGTALHHSISAFLLAAFLAGVVAPTRSIMGPISIVIMQHWFALLRYVSPNLYMAVELALEAWFEWSIFSTFHENAMNHWISALVSSVMLFAHWLYLLAGFLELVGGGTVGEEVATALSQRQLKIDLASSRRSMLAELQCDFSEHDAKITAAPTTLNLMDMTEKTGRDGSSSYSTGKDDFQATKDNFSDYISEEENSLVALDEHIFDV